MRSDSAREDKTGRCSHGQFTQSVVPIVPCSRKLWDLITIERRAMIVAVLVRLLLLQATLKTCLAGSVIKQPKFEDADGLIESTVKMLKFCHECPQRGLGVVGGPMDVLKSSLIFEPSIPVVFINDTSRRVDSAPVTSLKSHKLQLFLIMASSGSKLQEHLAGLKKLRWWNHMADFWLVQWPAQENDCANAYAFLWTAWRMNILEAKFICAHGTRGKLIYGFNPYTSYAPDPWRLESVYNGENEHPWSLLSRELSNRTCNSEPCRNMNFDKAKDLGGYEIRITVTESKFTRLSPNKIGIDAVDCPVCSSLKAILRSLNATAKLLVHGAKEPTGTFDAMGNVDGILAETYYGMSDIALYSNTHAKTSKLRRLNPHFFDGISIMTHYSGNASQVKKLISLVDVKSRVGLLFVCLLTFIFLKYFLRQTSSIASLNILRTICNSCLTKLPSRTSSRIFLGYFFFFVLTFQGIFQGALSSLLAKRVPLRNIENLEDLRKSDHTIYGHKEYGDFFSEPEFQGRFVGLEYYNCTEHVIRNTMNACVERHVRLIAEAVRCKLHLSKIAFGVQGLSYPIREDWPLERKFNQKFKALLETGVFYNEFDDDLKADLKTIEANDNENRPRRLKILNIDDLKFAFVILAIGLTTAAITFVVEVIRG